ncbi:hypothetical protein MPTK1_3g17200 [Marchantia polymorpha subsp. ruderalis]|uniref:Uncharacterized protein n=2 Tax=Marchantia polymorpha TaxID=3197 RepID=A0AAF6B1Q7_MARPO|nr:hypothetical protein MARPO_0039s0074 [Marchantia polymorpha]BBN05941.1 hypothetical protein Mp_3g17200 [Marchantia polymorpha subsp. ruderalis]|eukprot:PTQ40583.1 hypothetical protein MARPO_0039s0074 [Marchantia polymorpha]
MRSNAMQRELSHGRHECTSRANMCSSGLAISHPQALAACLCRSHSHTLSSSPCLLFFTWSARVAAMPHSDDGWLLAAACGSTNVSANCPSHQQAGRQAGSPPVRPRD